MKTSENIAKDTVLSASHVAIQSVCLGNTRILLSFYKQIEFHEYRKWLKKRRTKGFSIKFPS